MSETSDRGHAPVGVGTPLPPRSGTSPEQFVIEDKHIHLMECPWRLKQVEKSNNMTVDGSSSRHFCTLCVTLILCVSLPLIPLFGVMGKLTIPMDGMGVGFSIACISFGLFFMIYWIFVCMTPTRAYLKNVVFGLGPLKSYLRELRDEVPHLQLQTCSWHKEGSGSDEETIITHKETEDFVLNNSWIDETAPLSDERIDAEHPMAKFRFPIRYAFGDQSVIDAFNKQRNNMINRNRNRDKHLTFQTQFKVDGHHPHILVMMGHELPRCVSSGWYLFWSSLLLAWPFQYWLSSRTKKYTHNIVKKYQSRSNGDSTNIENVVVSTSTCDTHEEEKILKAK